MSDVFELARRYHDELGIKEPSLATMAAEFFDDLGLKIADFLRKEGYGHEVHRLRQEPRHGRDKRR